MLSRRYCLNTFRQFRRYTSASTNGSVLDFEQMPAPKGLPIVGTTLALLAAGSTPKLHLYVDRRHKELGPIYKEKIGPVTAIFLSDPEEMRSVFAQEGKYPVHILPECWMVYNELYGCSRGLFFMNGEEWLHYRRIMNKLLLKGELKWIDNSCNEASQNMLNRIILLNNQEFPNLEDELYRWSIEVIVSILLGADTYKLARKDMAPLVKRLASTVNLVFQTSAKLALISSKFASKYNISRWKRFVGSVDAALMSANELVTKLIDGFPNGNGLLNKMQQEKIPTSEITRIVADLVLAAGDTTAYSMEWMLYLLAKNKAVQEKLRKQNENEPSSGVLLKNVMRESLRLYPVAPFLTRILPDNAVISGYNVPAGSLIVMSVFTSGRDGKYYKDPEVFNPDRWLRTNNTANAVLQHASLPFAIGARSCIGRKIAESQLQLTLGMIVRNFDVELCNEKNVDIVLKMVAVPSEPIRLKFNKLS